MVEKYTGLKTRYKEINEQLLLPETLMDNKLSISLNKELKQLSPIIDKINEVEANEKNLEDANSMLNQEQDEEMKLFLAEELENCKKNDEKLNEELKLMLLPKDVNDDKNIILEIRGGAGGEEAALFAKEIFRMYSMYAESKRWKVEIQDINETELGGIKEVTALISGHNVYEKMKYESGVHRVQRVPETETQGRVHTSTITVAVLPEQQEVEFEILDKDLKIDTYRASGAGGQHINKTDSAIRITHLPTGIVVNCQDQRSQLKNRESAMNTLKTKLYDLYRNQMDEEYASNRKNQVGTGDRSERIRTYNYPQGRVTDHRIGLTLYSLTYFLNGDLDGMIEALTLEEQKKKLSEL